MSSVTDSLEDFIKYAHLLDGDEKGEAQVFCDRLFQAFGHGGYKEAGAKLEFRIKKKSTKGTSFADLVWKPWMLLEMKRRGTNLFHHYQQAFDYWIHAIPDRPRYVVLCNFDEFWIYDFDKQLDKPVDKVSINDLTLRYPALNFLFPENPEPIFGNDLEAVSREAADKVAQLFYVLVKRGINRSEAQRFTLQMVVAMFAEDIGLLPASLVSSLVDDCLHKGQSSYDLFGALFLQMNTKRPARGGKFRSVPYFNGGIFETVTPIDLQPPELLLIGGDSGAATEDWSKVNPTIFGTIFQQSMDKSKRHAHGSHFTSEADILRIVVPTIIKPWRKRIDKASTMKELLVLRRELMQFRVLDPACGSGNFLYLSYRELVRIEIALMAKLRETISIKNFQKQAKTISLISPKQFFGIERDSFGVELTKITLMLAKKLALDEAIEALESYQIELPLNKSDALPLENLDTNIVCDDALFANWPEVEVIIGNPPYQSKNKLQQELGKAYVDKVRQQFPDVDGRADYCVYWFRKAHDHLKKGQRAGLVGTNTIRQNYSRTGGLDYIVQNDGTIVEAVSSMKWPGEATVDVSIVNWIKGKAGGKKRLYIQEGNNPAQGWNYQDLNVIDAALSFATDVTQAKVIQANAAKGGCYQGQTHGHRGFLLTMKEAMEAINADSSNADVLFPYLIADELTGLKNVFPQRYVIDFQPRSLIESQAYDKLFSRIQELVLPDRKRKYAEEKQRNKEALERDPDARTNHHHANFLKKWWLLSWPRREMIEHIQSISRYIVCGQVTSYPIFDFVSPQIRPNAALIIFPYEDDYSYGILQSNIHWNWFTHRCSTLGVAPRYTSNTVFDSFPWPQKPTLKAIKKVANCAVELRTLRRKLLEQHNISLQDLYRSLELPGDSPLKDAHEKLDKAVRVAYGMGESTDQLSFLLNLNKSVARKEEAGEAVIGPGLPSGIKDSSMLVTEDCIRMPEASNL